MKTLRCSKCRLHYGDQGKVPVCEQGGHCSPERKPGDTWKPKDPTEILPGMFQFVLRGRCHECEAIEAVVVNAHLVKHILDSTNRNVGNTGMVFQPEDLALPEGWVLADYVLLCPKHKKEDDGSKSDG